MKKDWKRHIAYEVLVILVMLTVLMFLCLSLIHIYVHLGDWGLPMGLVLAELDERYGTDIPTLTTDMLNEIYPFASKKSKIDEAFLEKARTFTAQLQKKDPYLMEIWEKMIKLSVDDIRIIFDLSLIHILM